MVIQSGYNTLPQLNEKSREAEVAAEEVAAVEAAAEEEAEADAEVVVEVVAVMEAVEEEGEEVSEVVEEEVEITLENTKTGNTEIMGLADRHHLTRTTIATMRTTTGVRLHTRTMSTPVTRTPATLTERGAEARHQEGDP